MLTDDRMQQLVVNLTKWEGAIPWLYLDTDDPPNVTVGLGILVESSAVAQTMQFYNKLAKRPATVAEIASEFARVRAMKGSLIATRYQGYNGIELLPDEVVRLAKAKLVSRYLPSLVKSIPTFYSLPWPAQQGLVDIAWNAGSLAGFPSLVKACIASKWDVAAVQSHRAEPPKGRTRKERNDWTQALFASCARPLVA